MILEGWYSGGTEQYVAQLAAALRSEGAFRVHVVLLGGWDESLLSEARQYATKVHAIGKPLPAALWRLARIVRRLRPDICHCHLYTSLLPVAALLWTLGVPRTVATLHMPLSVWSLRHRLAWRAALRLTDRAVAVSRDVARSLNLPTWERTGRLRVVPSPIAPDAAAEPAPSADDPHGYTVVGCGRLSPQKDWPTLVRAFAALRREADPSARLLLLGDGPCREELLRLIAELGITAAVEMRGRVDRAAVPAQLRRGSVFVLPSRFEGLGLAALEAMQCGLPTIAADFPASLDFIDEGVTGHRFPRGDWTRLAGLLAWHAANPAESQRIGARGQQFVRERYSAARSCAEHVQIYLEHNTAPLEVQQCLCPK